MDAQSIPNELEPAFKASLLPSQRSVPQQIYPPQTSEMSKPVGRGNRPPRRGGGSSLYPTARRGRGGRNLRDPSAGLTMSNASSSSILYEGDLANLILTKREFQYYRGAARNMQLQCKARGLPLTRGGFVIKMVERLLMKIWQWMNEGILLRDYTVKLV